MNLLHRQNTNYKLILFDFDGTLADTSPGILNSIEYVTSKLNLKEISLEEKYTFIGPPMEESYKRVFSLEEAKLSNAVKYHKEYALLKGYKEVKIYPGITELLKKLKENNKLIGVATLKAETTANKILEEFKIDSYFDVVKGTNINKKQSKEDLIYDAINTLYINKDETILIGDSIYDAIGAMKADISFIGVTYGFGFKNKEDIKNMNCISMCDSVEELKRLLEDL